MVFLCVSIEVIRVLPCFCKFLPRSLCIGATALSSAPLCSRRPRRAPSDGMATGAAPARIQTFVFFDLEGTGLPSQPADYPVRIMELSLVAVQRPAGCGAAQPRRPAPGKLEHLPPNERGRVTPKRPTREHGEEAWECWGCGMGPGCNT